jgi:hypothetical protein
MIGGMADVFISYKQRMRPKVALIARSLEALGVSVWFDAELRAGKSFGAVINTELSRAGCVIVCWTPDAFAAEDGSDISWVEGEATIARERKVIVPIMLERTPLKAPWNMFHTERMMDWNGDPNDAAWLRVLDAIGKLIGRPGLADYAKAKAAGDPDALEQFAQQHPEAMPAPAGAKPKVTAASLMHLARAASREVRGVLAATVVAAIGAIGFMLRMGIESLESESSYLYLAAPVASSAVFAAGLWRGGALAFGRAVFSILAGLVGYVAALFTFPLIQPVAVLIGIPGPATLGFSQGLLAGGVGALVALSGIALLLGNIRRQGWVAVGIGSVVLGVVCGLMGGGLLSAIYPSNFFWMVLAWTLGYGALISVLVSRSARIM